MSGRNFSLTERLGAFVNDQVASGRHQNASEVVREALRRYEDDIQAERASIAVLEKVAVEGAAAIEHGDYTLVNGRDDARRLLNRIGKRAKERSETGSRKRRG